MPISNKALTLGALGAAIGAVMNNTGRNKTQFFSKERMIGSMLGFGLGVAAGETMVAANLGGLSGLALSSEPGTPLKRQPIVIVRTDSKEVLASAMIGTPLINRAARPLLGDRILIG